MKTLIRTGRTQDCAFPGFEAEFAPGLSDFPDDIVCDRLGPGAGPTPSEAAVVRVLLHCRILIAIRRVKITHENVAGALNSHKQYTFRRAFFTREFCSQSCAMRGADYNVN